MSLVPLASLAGICLVGSVAVKTPEDEQKRLSIL